MYKIQPENLIHNNLEIYFNLKNNMIRIEKKSELCNYTGKRFMAYFDIMNNILSFEQNNDIGIYLLSPAGNGRCCIPFKGKYMKNIGLTEDSYKFRSIVHMNSEGSIIINIFFNVKLKIRKITKNI